MVSFTVDSPPAGLTWLTQLSSYQRVDLHPDGKVHLHLSGPTQDLLAVHRRLRRATDVEVVRVADAVEEDVPVRGPRLTAAQRAAIEAAHAAEFFRVPRGTSLDELAEEPGQSRSSLSTLLRRGIGHLVEHLLGEEDQPPTDDLPTHAAPKEGSNQ